MLISLKNKKLSAKRGISSIVGTLIMVAVVAAIGSVIMFQGLNGINDFNYYLSFLTGSRNSSNENLIIEHVRFDPVTNDLDVWVRNTGTVEIEIAKITMVKMDNQVLILNKNPDTTVPISESANIHVLVADMPVGPVWLDPLYSTPPNNIYRISITTLLGNSFETTASPFNT
jgi:flagellin-like protein